MIGIYKVVSPVGKVYIGSSKNIQARFRFYKRLHAEQQPRLYYSLKKYGYDSHTFTIIEECSFESLFIRERYWQEYFDVTGPNGLNCLLVDTDELPRIVSDESRLKMSLSRKGVSKSLEHVKNQADSLKKHKRSKEHCENISKSLKGRKQSEETIQKRVEKQKGQKRTSETKEKLRKAMLERDCTWRKPVLQFDLEMNLIKKWGSALEIADTLGYSIFYIRDTSRGSYNHRAHKSYWFYEEITDI